MHSNYNYIAIFASEGLQSACHCENQNLKIRLHE